MRTRKVFVVRAWFVGFIFGTWETWLSLCLQRHVPHTSNIESATQKKNYLLLGNRCPDTSAFLDVGRFQGWLASISHIVAKRREGVGSKSCGGLKEEPEQVSRWDALIVCMVHDEKKDSICLPPANKCLKWRHAWRFLTGPRVVDSTKEVFKQDVSFRSTMPATPPKVTLHITSTLIIYQAKLRTRTKQILRKILCCWTKYFSPGLETRFYYNK